MVSTLEKTAYTAIKMMMMIIIMTPTATLKVTIKDRIKSNHAVLSLSKPDSTSEPGFHTMPSI